MSDAAGGPGFERRAADWLGWEEARDRILRAVEPGPVEEVPLAEAGGRALAEALTATATLPPWDNSAMDGYAVRGEDVAGASEDRPVTLRVVATTRAGERPGPELGPGEAARIMTGAPVPPGADSVIRVEHTDAEGTRGRVRIHRDSDRGRNIRPAGQDMGPGEEILEEGSPLHAGAIGVLAAMGRAEVRVHARPSVAILATGDELLPPERYDEVRAGAGVPESNGPMLAAAARAAGLEPELLDVAPDDPDVLEERLRRAAGHDAVVTIGGASMGEADLVKRVLDRLDFRQDFWRVRMRPGSPFSFGTLPSGGRAVPVFGLPGNPASAFVTFQLFARPALLRMAGHRRVLPRRIRAVAGQDLRAGPGKAYFLRVALEEAVGSAPRAVPTGPQGSGLVRGLATVDGLAVIPEDVEGIGAGEAVDVLLLDGGPGAVAWDPGAR